MLDPDKFEAFLGDLNHFDVETQASLIERVLKYQTPEQVRKLMKNPLISNVIQNSIENEKIPLDVREFLFSLKWKAISLFKEDNPNVLDPDKLEAFLGDLNHFDVETQASLIEGVLKYQTPEQVRKLMKNPLISNVIQNSIENEKIPLNVREDLFSLKSKAISLFKENDPNVLDNDKLKAFLRDLNFFDVETQTSLIRGVSNKWTLEQVQELMKNLLFSNLIQSFIENEKIFLNVRRNLFFLKWKAISLFKENDPNVLDNDKLKAFLRDLNFFDVETQASLIRGVSNKWTLEQVQELMENLLFSNLIQSFIENEKIFLNVRRNLFFLKWKAMSLFKEDSPNVLDPDKLEAFLGDLNHFDVETQASLIKGVLKYQTPEQIRELMKNLLFSNLIQSFIENEKISLKDRRILFFLKWKAIPLFKENDPSVFDTDKLEAFLRNLSFFDVETQDFLIREVSIRWNWTQKQIQELMDLLEVNQGQPPK